MQLPFRRQTKSKTPPKQELVQLFREALADGVPLDVVHERVTTFMERSNATDAMEQQDDRTLERRLRREVPRSTRIITTLSPLVFIVIGLVLVGNAVWPILSYYVFEAPNLRVVSLLSPVPKDELAVPKIVSQVQASSGDATLAQSGDQPTIIQDQLDYTNLSNWFTASNAQVSPEEQGVSYQLDIPAVDIQDASVHVGGSNLDKNVIQYPGTALPGQSGSPVIFGHSVLRQFYNPDIQNPRRYISIFSKIMTLEKGDYIYVTQDNVKYTYSVTDKSVVQPEDTFILDQNYGLKQLKLVTCVPEGTILERGVVTAELVSAK